MRALSLGFRVYSLDFKTLGLGFRIRAAPAIENRMAENMANYVETGLSSLVIQQMVGFTSLWGTYKATRVWRTEHLCVDYWVENLIVSPK